MARTAHYPIPEPVAFTPVRLVLLVFLPFASGYFLSYYFRTVNAVLAGRLMADLGLDAAQLGVITAAYFLIAAAAQLPLGFVLDRFGPRRVQAGCLLLAGVGALMFANAQDHVSLFVARGLIGLGVASALLAGLKALAMSCPPQRLGLFNGIFMSLGATGAIAASLPTEALLNWIDWRQLFVALAVATFASAGLIWSFVPKRLSAIPAKGVAVPGYLEIIKDRGFWQLAPLSALAVGGAWALQGLWGAPWLRDVARLDQQAIALHLVGTERRRALFRRRNQCARQARDQPRRHHERRIFALHPRRGRAGARRADLTPDLVVIDFRVRSGDGPELHDQCAALPEGMPRPREQRPQPFPFRSSVRGPEPRRPRRGTLAPR